ncbi:MAG TPA: sulfatase, partial [Tepidisphaeraceae bacterium]|nr:sulfatase [Tepidisphaeraceae bacterium]
PPNILFILLDDLGWKDLGCYGSPFYQTPHLDTLADQGMRFTDAYAACPVCSPTRASILTGQYPARVGITNWIPGNPHGKLLGVPFFHALPKNQTTIAAALKRAGYRSYHVGKWHLGPEGNGPAEFGFDVNIAGSHWGSPYNGYFSPWGMPHLPDTEEGKYLTDELTDHAIRLIRENGEQPFFMYFAHYAVHIPIQAPADLIAKYEAKARELGLDQAKTFQQGEFFPIDEKCDQRVVRRLIQSDPAYAAMIENLDTNIGRLLAALDAAGKADDTIVVFTSDNGGLSTAEGSPTCNAPLSEGKGWMYDGGVREPLLIRYPRMIRPGSACSAPVTSPDFFPTFLEAAGLPLMPEQHADGTSLMPLLRGDSLGSRPIFWHYPHYSNQGGTPACAIRRDDWKLIEFFEDNHLELYNLRTDISEQNDLAAEHSGLATELHDQLVTWRRALEAKIPAPNPNYQAELSAWTARRATADVTKCNL